MAPPTFTPISVANRWKAGEVTSSPSLISDAFDCSKRGPVKALHAAIALSLKVERSPLKVFDCACIPPPNALPMPSSRILIALPAGSKPFSLIFWASAVVIPMPSESSCQAGIPTSASCIMSCALTLPFACICPRAVRSEEHTSELQSQSNLVCRLLLEKKKKRYHHTDRQS